MPAIVTLDTGETTDGGYFCTASGTRESFTLDMRAALEIKVGDDWIDVISKLETGSL